MINKEKSMRLQVTVSKEQGQWITNNAVKLGMTISQFIKWLLNKNLGNALSNYSKLDRARIEMIAGKPIPQTLEEQQKEQEETKLTHDKINEIMNFIVDKPIPKIETEDDLPF